MEIMPSTSLRNQYNEISEKCKTTGEPIYLTKNGEGDGVFMSIEAFNKRQKESELMIKILEVELARLHGAKDYTIEELEVNLKKILGI